jgi:hypothetical protein
VINEGLTGFMRDYNFAARNNGLINRADAQQYLKRHEMSLLTAFAASLDPNNALRIFL